MLFVIGYYFLVAIVTSEEEYEKKAYLTAGIRE